MVTHSSILARRIPWRDKTARLQSTGLQSRTRLSNFTFTFTLANASCSTFFIFIFSEGVLLFPKIHTKLLSVGSQVSYKTEAIIFEVTWQLIPNYIDRSY